ncbi:MAG: signal peptidase II [Anaerolineae bacterium]|nr:signal peptidase II [Gemmatimonadaceae bacterium]
MSQSSHVAQGVTKAQMFWPAFGAVLVLDIVTKYLAVRMLPAMYVPRPVIGDVLRFTLAYNRGAAFGTDVGEWSRWVFTVVAILVLIFLAHTYRETDAADRLRALALGLVCGGAVGNVIDRLRSELGVIDFIDIGIGSARWYTFNVADMGVSIGALLLAWSFWREGKKGESRQVLDSR